MKLMANPKTIFCLALLLGWGNCVPAARAHAWHELILLGDVAAARVHTPRGDYGAFFQSEARVFPNGEANGFLTLDPLDAAPHHGGGMNVVVGDGSVRFLRDGSVAGVLLRGREVESDRLLIVRVTPAATEDCLIYTTVGSDVHATWETPGRFIVVR